MRFAVYGDLSRSEYRWPAAKPIRTWSRRVTPPCFASIEYREHFDTIGQINQRIGWNIWGAFELDRQRQSRIEKEITDEDIWDISVPREHPEDNELFPEDYQLERFRHYLSTEGGPSRLKDEERIQGTFPIGRSAPLALSLENTIRREILLYGPTRRVWVYSVAGLEISEEVNKQTTFFLVQSREERAVHFPERDNPLYVDWRETDQFTRVSGITREFQDRLEGLRGYIHFAIGVYGWLPIDYVGEIDPAQVYQILSVRIQTYKWYLPVGAGAA